MVNSLFTTIDARTKLFIGISIAICVFLPLKGLVVLFGGVLILLSVGGLSKIAYRYVYNARWVILFIFAIDWVMIDFNFSASVCLRFTLLTISLLFFTETTSHDELYSLFRWCRIPAHFSFSLVTGLRSVRIVSQKWHIIRETQKVRGITPRVNLKGLRKIRDSLQSLLPLCIPAVVLSVKRSWNITEAAYLLWKKLDYLRTCRSGFRKIKLKL